MQLHDGSRLRRLALGTAAALVALPVAACSAGSDGASSSPEPGDASQVAKTSKASVAANVDDGSSSVKVDQLVKLDATDGTFPTFQCGLHWLSPNGLTLK